MKVKSVSSFKDQQTAEEFFAHWVQEVSSLSGTRYDHLSIDTSLGKTIVWGINSSRAELQTLVIFPGFRTSSLFWDMDNALEPFKRDYRIFMIETNGQPVLSEGNTPDIRTNDYGEWASEVLRKLAIEKAIIAGASFGGLLCLKLCIVAPQLVEKVILLNPGCLQPFSLSPKNLYFNLLPLIFPTRRNIERFLDNAVFYRNTHTVSPSAKKLIIDYEYFAITQFRDKTQKPYSMRKKELRRITTDVYLLLGDKDILFPMNRSINRATRFLAQLKEIAIIPGTGHGIETSKQAHQKIAKFLQHN